MKLFLLEDILLSGMEKIIITSRLHQEFISINFWLVISNKPEK